MNNEVGEKLLPIGTVVVLKGATRKVMITGYAIIPVGELRKGDNTKEEITKEEVEIVQTDLIKEAVAPLNNAQLRNYLLKAKQTHEQIIDDINTGKMNW